MISAASVLFPNPKPLTDPGPDRDHVLQRRADFDANRVRIGIQPEGGAGKRRLHLRRDLRHPATATTTAAGSPQATSRANVGPESTAIFSGNGSNFLDHLGHAQQRSLLQSLVALTKVIAGSRNGRHRV